MKLKECEMKKIILIVTILIGVVFGKCVDPVVNYHIVDPIQIKKDDRFKIGAVYSLDETTCDLTDVKFMVIRSKKGNLFQIFKPVGDRPAFVVEDKVIFRPSLFHWKDMYFNLLVNAKNADGLDKLYLVLKDGKRIDPHVLLLANEVKNNNVEGVFKKNVSLREVFQSAEIDYNMLQLAYNDQDYEEVVKIAPKLITYVEKHLNKKYRDLGLSQLGALIDRMPPGAEKDLLTWDYNARIWLFKSEGKKSVKKSFQRVERSQYTEPKPFYGALIIEKEENEFCYDSKCTHEYLIKLPRDAYDENGFLKAKVILDTPFGTTGKILYGDNEEGYMFDNNDILKFDMTPVKSKFGDYDIVINIDSKAKFKAIIITKHGKRIKLPIKIEER
jgi:hypothetical protein